MMTDSIEREPLLAWLSNMEVSENIINAISNKERFPPSNVAEIKHGYWTVVEKQCGNETDGFWTERYLQCSVCTYNRRHSWVRGETPKYCEACGSDMRGEQDGK